MHAWLALRWCVCVCLAAAVREAVVLNVNDVQVFKEAEFAVTELRKLSESGVYESLSLTRIKEAYYSDGIFHHNTIFTLELSSPYYASKRETEDYRVVVMTNKADGAKSFAIDEFPVMDDDAIEEHWVRMVEAKRQAREEAFRRIELEYALSKQPITDEEASLADLTTDQLFDRLDETRDINARRAAAEELSERLAQSEEGSSERDDVLKSLPSKKLFEIVNDVSAPHYDRYRARVTLDERLGR